MQIDQYHTIPLSHRNYFGVKGNHTGNLWLAANADGQYTMFNNEGIASTGVLSFPIKSIDFLPQQELIACCTSTQLHLRTIKGETIFELDGHYQHVYLAADEQLLWTIETPDNNEAVISVFSIADKKILATLTIEDIYGQSSYSIYSGANENNLVLYMAAGQDGQSTFFLTIENNKLVAVKLPLEDCSQAIFNKSGTNYIQSNEEAIYVYDYPNNELIQTICYPEHQPPADYFGFINDALLIIAGSTMPLLADIRQRTLDPIIIKEHEPKPFSHYHPNLKNDWEETTDIEGVDVWGNNAFFHCRNFQNKDLEKHSILRVLMK